MKEFIIGMTILAFSVLLMINFWTYNLLLSTLYLVVVLLLLKYLNLSEIILFVFTSLLFLVGEGVLVKHGLWTYNNPTYYGIPLWLFLSWGCTSVAISKIYRGIEEFCHDFDI